MTYSPDYSLKLASERQFAGGLPEAISAEALEIGKSRVPVTVRDLSSHEATFEADHRYLPGTRIWLFFPSGLAVNAQAVWANGRMHGCRFVQRLSEGELLLAQSPR